MGQKILERSLNEGCGLARGSGEGFLRCASRFEEKRRRLASLEMTVGSGFLGRRELMAGNGLEFEEALGYWRRKPA